MMHDFPRARADVIADRTDEIGTTIIRFLEANERAWPVHRFFHTYLGATLVAILTVVIGKPLSEQAIRLWNGRLRQTHRDRLEIARRIPWVAAAVGALFGAYSHVFLDSVMHSDLHPFAPWWNGNGLLNLVTVAHLYLYCAGSGVLGVVVWLMILLRNKL